MIVRTGFLFFVFASLVSIGMASENKEEAAKQAALTWLELVDSGQYRASWDKAATPFKMQVSSDQWEKAVQSARRPLGALVSRRFASSHYTTTLPGAPDGEYVVLQFETKFENKASATETVTPMLDDGAWRVSGYYIR